MTNAKNAGLRMLLPALAILTPDGSADAAEGASSRYLPGMAGDIAIAVPPKPGLQLSNTVWVQVGNVNQAVLQGVVDVGLDIDVVLDLVGGSYTFAVPALGGTYTVAALIPFGYANLNAEATGPRAQEVGASGDSFDLADIALVPLQLNWSVGEFSFKFGETIVAPTGGYDVDERVNLGRNYWSFDTVGAATWLHAPAARSGTMRCGCSCLRWPTTSPTFFACWRCPMRSPNDRGPRCARSWSRLPLGLCAMAATSSSSSPRSPCQGRSFPRSRRTPVGSTDHPCSGRRKPERSQDASKVVAAVRRGDFDCPVPASSESGFRAMVEPGRRKLGRICGRPSVNRSPNLLNEPEGPLVSMV